MFDIIFISMLWKDSQGTILDVADFGTVQNYCKKFFIQIPSSDLKIHWLFTAKGTKPLSDVSYHV